MKKATNISNGVKIIYIANVRIPTEKAHGIQIMKMCEAFSELKVESEKLKVELVLPWRFNKIKQDPFEYYGVKKNFRITKIPSLDLVKFGKIGFRIQSLSFACSAFWYVLFQKADIIYSRDELPLSYLSFFKKNLVWETHTARKNFLVARVLKKSRGIISITQGLKDFYIKEYNLDSSRILVAPDGVDINKFKVESEKLKVRERLNLPADKKIVLYTGHLYSWKGVDTLVDSGKFLNGNILIYLIGGTESDINDYKSRVKNRENIKIGGYRPHGEMPIWMKAADVLVLPNTAKEDISKYYTSPMKLFEYMASGTPIVASDMPSIREILNENNAILVEPDNPEKLAEGIARVLQNPDFADRIARQACEDVQNHTWEKRVKEILEFVNR